MLAKFFSKSKTGNQAADGEMTFLEHLDIFRKHLIRMVVYVLVCAAGLFVAKDFVFRHVIFAPRYEDFFSYKMICKLSNFLGLRDSLCMTPPDFQVQGVNFGELFTTHLKVSFFLGVVVAFPLILWELWKFIKPGLYPNEQKAARGFVSVCSFLFLTGVLFGYYIISPFAITFLAGYQIEGAIAAPTLDSYVNYMVMFTLPVGLVFELPIVVYFLSKIGIVGPAMMRKYRRHAIVIILIAAAIITPPDVVTQFMVGIPLYILYELSILVSERVVKKSTALTNV